MTTEKIDRDLEHELIPGDSRTAGSVLKAERIRRNLDEDVVAEKLHITKHYVRAIESDRYEKLPGAVFAKGYIKSYAQLLKLDEKLIIGLYSQLVTLQTDEALEEVRIKAAGTRVALLPWLIMLGIVILATGAGYWAYTMFFSGTASTGAPTVNELVQNQFDNGDLVAPVESYSALFTVGH